MTSRRPRRRSTLATRIALLSVAIAVVTALVAGVIATGLVRSAGSDSARHTLGRLADVAQTVTGERSGRVASVRLRRALQGLNVQSGVLNPRGGLLTANPLVRRALTPADAQRVLAGRTVSASRSVTGGTVFVEARPTTNGGGVVLVQRRTDAVAPDERALRRLVLALLIAAAAAVALGLVVAGRLARPLRRTAAAAHSVAAGNRDVTLPADGPAEVVAVGEAVSSIAGALRHSEARQREFLLSVSHDLRTPLTAITGYAESMAEGLVAPEDTARVGGVVLGEARRLERLVGDLLDLARLGADDFRVEPVVVDLAALAEDAAQVWQARSAASGVEFRLERAPGPLLTRTDPTRVRQVLDGLFDNALRVTPAGAPVVLAVRAEPALAGVVAEVRDGGPGLTDDDLAVAFAQGVLHQRYRNERQVGTGLGLAIVQGLVTRLGGRVEAGHAPEGGARFTVLLPPA